MRSRSSISQYSSPSILKLTQNPATPLTMPANRVSSPSFSLTICFNCRHAARLSCGWLRRDRCLPAERCGCLHCWPDRTAIRDAVRRRVGKRSPGDGDDGNDLCGSLLGARPAFDDTKLATHAAMLAAMRKREQEKGAPEQAAFQPGRPLWSAASFGIGPFIERKHGSTRLTFGDEYVAQAPDGLDVKRIGGIGFDQFAQA